MPPQPDPLDVLIRDLFVAAPDATLRLHVRGDGTPGVQNRCLCGRWKWAETRLCADCDRRRTAPGR